MAVFGVRIYCYTHGATLVTVDFVSERAGSTNDHCQLRVQRRKSGEPTITLPHEPFFTLTGEEDARHWTWLDADVPSEGEWDYVLQIKRIDGSGVFGNMIMGAVHHKR